MLIIETTTTATDELPTSKRYQLKPITNCKDSKKKQVKHAVYNTYL